MGSTLFRDPQARGSALAALGTLQPQAFRSLRSVEPLDSVSNYYMYMYFGSCSSLEVHVQDTNRIEWYSVLQSMTQSHTSECHSSRITQPNAITV